MVTRGRRGQVFEFPAFASGTQALLQAMAVRRPSLAVARHSHPSRTRHCPLTRIQAATAMNGAVTIVGGGDSAAATRMFGLEEVP